jgi:hypothetical protein
MVSNVKNRIGAIIDWCGKRVLRSSSIADAYEDGLSPLCTYSCPITIVMRLAQNKTTSMEIDNGWKLVVWVGMQGLTVPRR